MRGFKITIFGMITVSLDMRTVTLFFFMQFEDVCIPISTLTHSGNLYYFPARRSSPPKFGGARTPMTNTSVP